MKKIVAYALVALVLVYVAYDNRDRIGPLVGTSAEGAPAKPANPLALKGTADVRARAFCIDGSGSTSASFAKSIKRSIIKSVQGYVPPKPTVTKGGVDSIVGLDVTVRLVSTRPLEYGAPFYRVKVAGVDGLPPRPDMAEGGALSTGGSYETFKKLEAEWSGQYDAALSDLRKAVGTLSKIDLSRPSASGVHDCLGALASTAPATRDLTFVVASDLQDNTDGASKVSFAGHPLVVVQACPSGAAGECSHVLRQFRTWADDRKAGDLTVVRPEVADDIINHLIEGD